MQAITMQRLIAIPYLVLGSWCLIAPQMVERLTVSPAYQHLSPTSALFIGCFGAQAVLGGLFVWFSRFTQTTFLIYAIGLLPFSASIIGSSMKCRFSTDGWPSISAQTRGCWRLAFGVGGL